jgi:hypothetical protein
MFAVVGLLEGLGGGRRGKENDRVDMLKYISFV